MPRYLLGMLIVLTAFTASARAAVDAKQVREECERIEAVRRLLRAGIEDAQVSRTLAGYLRGWGGPQRDFQAEDLVIEAERLYGFIRGADYGAQAAHAQLGTKDAPPVSDEQLALLRRARAEAARRVLDFANRSVALRADLRGDVLTRANDLTKWRINSEPLPWPDAAREAGRKAGVRFGWNWRDGEMKLPESDRLYLLAKAKLQGVRFVNADAPGLSDWSQIEREAGKYDFTALDSMMNELIAAGMRVAPRLYTLTGKPPAWHLDQHGPASALTGKGRDGKPDPRGINVFHPPTAESFGRFAAAYAEHLRDRFADHIDAIYIEGALSEIEAPATDSLADFAPFDKQAQADGVTGSWRSPETIASTQPFDASAHARAESLRERWLVEYATRVAAMLKKGWPNTLVQLPTVSEDFHRLHGLARGPGRDLQQLAAVSTNPTTATDNPASYALLRSFAGGRWLWSRDVHSGCGTVGGSTAAQAPWFDSIRIVHGNPNNSIRANFPQGWFRYSDFQTGDFGIGAYQATPRRAQLLGTIATNTRAYRAEVAILWSQSTMRRDHGREFYADALATGHLLQRSFVTFDYIGEPSLATNLKRYKALILPNSQSMRDGDIAVIREWVRAGGVLLAFGAPGIFDELGSRRDKHPLAEVFGADLSRLREPGPVTPDKLFTGHPEGSYVFVDPEPRGYLFRSDLTAALTPTTGKARAWYAGDAKEVAIVENTFERGKVLCCGYPLGYQYYQSAPYEFAFGVSHSRHLNYNEAQKRYEKWLPAELAKLGIGRDLVAEHGTFLRAQRGDDGDWYHVFRNSPSYKQYQWEDETPARTIHTVLRSRDGVNNVYVGMINTESNFMWERGYFVSTLGGGSVSASIDWSAYAPEPAQERDPKKNDPKPARSPAVVWDVLADAPVPCAVTDNRLKFTTWIPTAQSSGFAIAPDGAVRLFGTQAIDGVSPDALKKQVEAMANERALASVEVLDLASVHAFLDARKGKAILVGAPDERYRPVFTPLAAWLKKAYGIDATMTTAGSRTKLRYDYQDGFGWPQILGEPTQPEILLGNAQDNALMYRFLQCHGDLLWMPVEVNQDFPGLGVGVVMLSSPLTTRADGKPGGKKTEPRLILGGSFPSETLQAVNSLIGVKGDRK